jgi:hypothetical protein
MVTMNVLILNYILCALINKMQSLGKQRLQKNIRTRADKSLALKENKLWG